MPEPRKPTRLRALFPPNGPGYELFDSSVLLLLLAGINYVLTTPSPAVQSSLAAPLRFAPESVWGLALAGCGLLGVICSYSIRLLDLGYSIVVTATLFWAACFILGVLFFDGPVRGIGSALIWGWIARRTFRESRRIM